MQIMCTYLLHQVCVTVSPNPQVRAGPRASVLAFSMGRGDGIAPPQRQMDGRLGMYGPLPGNLLGTGGLAAGVVAPGRHGSFTAMQ